MHRLYLSQYMRKIAFRPLSYIIYPKNDKQVTDKERVTLPEEAAKIGSNSSLTYCKCTKENEQSIDRSFITKFLIEMTSLRP